MRKINLKKQPAAIRVFILQNITRHQKNTIAMAAEKFGLTRQTVLKYLQKLADENLLVIKGTPRAPIYELKPIADGDESLVSRSQARRLLARFERFKEVILDFEGIASIGQAFADEIFRVFVQENPHIHLTPLNANDEVLKMISRAKNQKTHIS
jgi:hypothetical protein